MKKKKNIAGFTLIELLVVIAIIALLLSVLVPGLKKAKDHARRVVCAGRLNQIGVAMKLYAETYKEFLPPNTDNAGNREMHGFVVYRNDKPQYLKPDGIPMPLRFAYLYETGLMDVPETFYCPGNTNPDYKYESYINPPPWGKLDQEYNKTKTTPNQWVRIGYTYYPVERNAKLLAAGYPDPDKAVTKYTHLNLNIPYATDVLHNLKNVSHQSNSSYDSNGNVLSYGNYALNTLYGDGHVSTCRDQSVFKNTIWSSFGDGDSATYDRCYYTIFRLIGP